MQKIILAIGIFTVFVTSAFGQCPNAGFTLPDSVCAGTSFQVTNTSTPGMSYFWDLCPGDLQTTATETMLPGDPLLNFPQQIKMITDNGNYYLFVANLFGNNLLRYDFGTSVDNTPVVYNYGNIGLLNGPAGIDIVSENGIWYALIANYNVNTVIRVDLGSVIANNTASATSLGSFNLNLPIGLKIAKDGNNYYSFVSNSAGPNLIRIDLGNSITNTPSGFTVLTDPSFDSGWGFDVAYDCSISKWIGFYVSYSLGKINVLNFGNSLANPVTLEPSITTGSFPTGVILARDGINWHLLSLTIGGAAFQNFKFSGSLLTTPTPVTAGSMVLPSPRGLALVRDSTSSKLFIAENNPSNITKFTFQKNCSVSPAVSNDPTGVNPILSSSNNYHEITLEVTGPNGETTVYSDSIFVIETPQASFTNSLTCEGQPVQFTDASVTDTSLATTWSWDFGDSSPVSTDQNPVHNYLTAGTYGVSLTTTYVGGCSNTFTDSITMHPLPDAAFSFPNNQCAAVPVQFSDLSQAFSGAVITSWNWDFGDGSDADTIQNPVHIFNNPGTFTVVLTALASTGCSDTVSQTITIIPSPETNFTVASTCIGETVNFTNTTTIQGGLTLTYDWDFGDTFTSALTDPTHAYAAVTGSYFVTLVTTASNGCKDTLTDSIRISNRPVPQFSFTPLIVCKSNQVSFTSTSTGTGGDTISNYIWDFGDATFSNDENPFHAYADTGYYDVTLTVVSPTACDSSLTLQLYVIPSPTATFTANNVCLGLTTNFNPSVTTPPNTQIDSIVWDFGDGDIFNGLSSPSHTYITPGRYGVSMTVYNNLLCTASYIDSVDIFPIPVADFTTSILCSDSLVTFDGSISQVTGDSISSWIWDFDGLGTASGSPALFNFQNAGTYDISLIVFTQNGCSDTVTKPITVIQSPEFDFTFNEPCFGLPSIFTYIPNITPAPNAILTWNFGDGTTSAILNPSHIYAAIDTFMVSLKVVHNATGCAGTLTKLLIVKPYPDAGFSFTNNCEGLPVQFTDTSSISAGNIAAWNWNFGVLGNSTTENPVITPADPGAYPITLTVTSDEGCAASASNTLTVFENPLASFLPDPLYGSPPLTVNFINNSIGGITFDWNFGDGNTGSGNNPVHIYQDTGVYYAAMIATSAEGCIASTSHPISVLIPYLDLAIKKVYASQNNDLLGLSAEVVNMGNIPVQTFQIQGIIENGSIINESWTGQLQPGTSFIYEFNASYNLASKTLPGYYCAEVMHPNNLTDANHNNNSMCAVIGDAFEIYSAYPNPFSDQVTLSFNLPIEEDFNIQVYDIAGKLVFEKNNQSGVKGYNKIVIPTMNYNKGIYAVTLQYRDEIRVTKIMNY